MEKYYIQIVVNIELNHKFLFLKDYSTQLYKFKIYKFKIGVLNVQRCNYRARAK